MSYCCSILTTFRCFMIVTSAILIAAGIATSQSFYYEVRYAGFMPGVNDWAVMSAEEIVPSNVQGIFADFSTGGEFDAVNNAAVLDAGYHEQVLNSFYPTGQMAVAKVSNSSNGAIIDFYLPVSWNTSYRKRQEFPGPGQNSDNTVRQWQIPTASRNAVQAMDIACGLADPTNPHKITSYLITAEPVSGVIWIVAYALTDVWGNPVMPYLVNGISTGIPGSTCLGLTTSPGRVGTVVPSNDRTGNEIVYVTTDPVNGLVARAETFDVRTALFGRQLNPPAQSTYSVPFPMNSFGNTIAGIWIAQDNPLNPQLAHHVGISIPNQQQPGAAGTMVSLPASTQQPLTPRFQGGLGGGPLSHVPWGHNPGVLFCGGPAYWMFGTNGGSNGPGPTGWYVVTPGILPTLTAIHAVDTALNSQYFYSYPVGAVPNGTPLAHPADISKSGISTHIKGIAWVPYSFPGIVVYSLDLLVAAPAGPTTQSTAQHTIGSPLGGNFPGLPQLPKQRPVPPHPNWQGTIILQDQKTNFKAEYGLGLWGY